MQLDDKEQVQHNVDNSGQRKKVKRPLCISHRSQDCAAEVVSHHDRHSRKVYFHIDNGLFDHILRSPHQLQHEPGGKQAEEYKDGSAHQTDGNSRMYRLTDIFLTLRPVITGNQYIRSY